MIYYSIEPAAWERFTRPIRMFCDPDELPFAAAYGASNACDTTIPITVSGASTSALQDWPD